MTRLRLLLASGVIGFISLLATAGLAGCDPPASGPGAQDPSKLSFELDDHAEGQQKACLTGDVSYRIEGGHPTPGSSCDLIGNKARSLGDTSAGRYYLLKGCEQYQDASSCLHLLIALSPELSCSASSGVLECKSYGPNYGATGPFRPQDLDVTQAEIDHVRALLRPHCEGSAGPIKNSEDVDMTPEICGRLADLYHERQPVDLELAARFYQHACATGYSGSCLQARGLGKPVSDKIADGASARYDAEAERTRQNFKTELRQDRANEERRNESNERALSDAVNAATGNNGALSGNTGSIASHSDSARPPSGSSSGTAQPGKNACGERYFSDANGNCVLKTECDPGWHVCPASDHSARACCPN